METVPFHSGEEAWFWHLRACEFSGLPTRMWPQELSSIPRPCEPHEVFVEIIRAFQSNVLSTRHMEVVNRSTIDGPHSLDPDDVEWFDGAMAVLDARLRKKGIVVGRS